MKQKDGKKNFERKVGISLGTVSAIVIAAMVIYATIPKPVLEQTDDGEWQIVWEGSIVSAAENNPGAGASGWLSTFLLDAGETPETCLADNATNGAYDGWGNVTGYQNADNAPAMDIPSEDPFYPVVRCRFNTTHCQDAGSWNFTRARCWLTMTGDETIGRFEIDNSSNDGSNSGDAVISAHDSDFMYVNFWWDDNDNQYQITDDGSLVWNITIYARY